jgi:HD-GYP domain-containing protein (c-di-GMP phosphodiesterase class II)
MNAGAPLLAVAPALASLPGGIFDSTLRVKELEDQLVSLRASLVCAFNQLLDLKDLNTGYHSTRLAEWSVRVAQELGLEEGRFADMEVTAPWLLWLVTA